MLIAGHRAASQSTTRPGGMTPTPRLSVPLLFSPLSATHPLSRRRRRPRRPRHLLDPAPPLVHLEHLPIHLHAVLLEYPLDLRRDDLEVARGEGEDGGARAGEADAEKTGVGGVGEGGEDLGEAGDLWG